MPVLGLVDVPRVRAEDHRASVEEAHRKVVRSLAAHRQHDARGALELVDVEHALERELLEVEPVADVVVRAHRLGIAVDHDRGLAGVADRLHRVDAAPVELDARADAVDARAEDDNAAVGGLEVVLIPAIGRVEVVCLGRVLGGKGVDMRLKLGGSPLLRGGRVRRLRWSPRARPGARRRIRGAWPRGGPPCSGRGVGRPGRLPGNLGDDRLLDSGTLAILPRNRRSILVRAWISSMDQPSERAR